MTRYTKSSSPTRRISGLIVSLLLVASLLSLIVFESEPVRAQTDNFGYDNIGGTGYYIATSYYTPNEMIRGSVFTSTETNTADSITVALKRANTGSDNAKCAIYKHSDLSLVGSTEQVNVSFTMSYAWYTFNFVDPKPSLTADEEYILVVWADYTTQHILIAADSGDTDQSHNQLLAYAATFPNPLVPDHGTLKYSIYCTYSTAAAPGKPVLVSPENNYSTSDNTPTFTWTAGSGATSHRLVIDNDSTFSDGDNIYDNANLGGSDTSCTIENELPPDNYWWKVCATNAEGDNWSENTWTFEITTIPQPPSKPELIKLIENQPYFEWTTAEYADNYRLLIDNNIGFSSPWEDRVLIDNYYQIPVENALDNGVYWWKVIAQNEGGENTSDVWTFTVGGVKAEPPIDLVAAAMFLFPIVLMGIALAFDNVVFASFAGIVFVFSGLYFIDIIWLAMIFIGIGIYLLVTAFMSEED